MCLAAPQTIAGGTFRAVIGSGAGLLVDDALTVRTTLGQPIAGVIPDGSVDRVRAGFWYLHDGSILLDSPGAPAPLPVRYRLLPSIPNPAHTRTTVAFELPRESRVRVAIYGVTGRRVATVTDGERPPGRHVLDVDTSAFAAGVYFFRIEAEGFHASHRLIVVR